MSSAGRSRRRRLARALMSGKPCGGCGAVAELVIDEAGDRGWVLAHAEGCAAAGLAGATSPGLVAEGPPGVVGSLAPEGAETPAVRLLSLVDESDTHGGWSQSLEPEPAATSDPARRIPPSSDSTSKGRREGGGEA